MAMEGPALRERWTDEELDRALELTRAGTPIDDVAHMLGRTSRAVRLKLWKHGHLAGKPITHWSDAEVRHAFLLRDRGWTFHRIGEALERSAEAVQDKLSRTRRPK